MAVNSNFQIPTELEPGLGISEQVMRGIGMARQIMQQRQQLGLEQQQLQQKTQFESADIDIRRQAEARAQAEAPGTMAATAARTRLESAQASGAEQMVQNRAELSDALSGKIQSPASPSAPNAYIPSGTAPYFQAGVAGIIAPLGDLTDNEKAMLNTAPSKGLSTAVKEGNKAAYYDAFTEQVDKIAEQRHQDQLEKVRQAAMNERQVSGQIQQFSLNAVQFSEQETKASQADIVKAGQKYNDNVRPAEELENMIGLAKGGNKEAGALTRTQAVNAIERASDLKRISPVVFSSVAGAGSLLDRIQGTVGSWTEGQPVPPGLQADFIKLAKDLKDGAYTQYTRDVDVANAGYGTSGKARTREQMDSARAVPSGGSQIGDTKTFPNGSIGKWDGTGWVKQ